MVNYTPKQLAQEWQVGYRTILELIRSGELGAFQVGGNYRVSEKHVADYIKAHTLQCEMKTTGVRRV